MATNWLVFQNILAEFTGPAIPIVANTQYEPRAVHSINASNELQCTFWIVKDGVQMLTDIGAATYLIRDQDGNTIGITESGLVPVANGFYKITPVLADAIQDLTHYTVEISIYADDSNRKGVIGITLGE